MFSDLPITISTLMMFIKGWVKEFCIPGCVALCLQLITSCLGIKSQPGSRIFSAFHGAKFLTPCCKAFGLRTSP